MNRLSSLLLARAVILLLMQLDKAYEPKQYETEIYQKWEASGAFMASGKGEPFCIIMPPPNANGELHSGHAIGYSLADAIIRYQRMLGKNTLWLPGTDHAGIETQFVFERDVLAKRGTDRFELGPDKFYAEVMKFTLKNQQNIINQFKAMGFSADWSKLKFTLDQDIVGIVYDTFAKLHKDGHIYRGNRIVNWCPRCQAAFADIELDHPQRSDVMYTLDYGPLKIATTRPETIFADVAVAVNPKDPRYKDLIGQEATVPITKRKVPIIADTQVDPKVGTGALKVTPGHDPTDYEIGKRHNLPEISVIDLDGKLINVPDQFAGLDVETGRQTTVEALKAAGKLAGNETITHSLAIHDRCGTVIEPLISEQWFLRVKQLNQPVIRALESDQVKLVPARFKTIALDWLTNEHDWCISRQIWWGIRIPVYYRTSHDKDKQPYLIAKSEDEAKKYYGEGNYRAETDTFDTWFSSGQWPYATLMSTNSYETFYPSALMATARDILHKWVTRMVMFGLYSTSRVPFEKVYLYGLVTDARGKKMSKSKGNVVDPLALTAKYGTDALRLAGAMSNTPGNDSPMQEDQVDAMRNFCNKLWNTARFVLGKVADQPVKSSDQPQNLVDEWFLDRLRQASEEITSKLDNYRLNEAAGGVYHLLWDDFADWYLEASKSQPNSGLLLYGLETILKLAHPFVPFVTEAIWGKLPQTDSMLISAAWPSPAKSYPESAIKFDQIKAMVSEIRAVRAELDLPPVPLYHRNNEAIAQAANMIKQLAGISEITSVDTGEGLPLLSLTDGWLGVDHETVGNYKTSLEAKRTAAKTYADKLGAELSNQDFKRSAPKEVVKQTEVRLEQAQRKLKFLNQQLERLANI